MKGYIYIIRCINNNLIYIGSTKQNINIRYSKHIYDSKIEKRAKPFHKIVMSNDGWDNFNINILKEIECNSIEELRCHESKIIDDYRKNANFKLMNTNK